MSRRLHRLWWHEQTFQRWQEASTDNQQTEKEGFEMGDIFGVTKMIGQLMLRSQAPAKPALSVDEEIASLRARPDLDPEGKRLTELYRLRVGPQKLKTYKVAQKPTQNSDEKK